MLNIPKSDTLMFCPVLLFVEQNQRRTELSAATDFIRISSEVVPAAVLNHKRLTDHGIVGAKSWTAF